MKQNEVNKKNIGNNKIDVEGKWREQKRRNSWRKQD